MEFHHNRHRRQVVNVSSGLEWLTVRSVTDRMCGVEIGFADLAQSLLNQVVTNCEQTFGRWRKVQMVIVARQQRAEQSQFFIATASRGAYDAFCTSCGS